MSMKLVRDITPHWDQSHKLKFKLLNSGIPPPAQIKKSATMMMRKLLRSARRQLHTIISKETIKPSSPTPSHLKTYNLSLTDQFNPPVYMPVIFFYPNYPSSALTATSTREKVAQLLKNSLSQTLTQYYPFSGTLISATDGAYVDCVDEGVVFVEAQVNACLSEVVRPHDSGYQSVDHFFANGSAWGRTHNKPLAMVQLSHFVCGGLALAVSVSHKIGDAISLINFISQWAEIARKNAGNCKQNVLALPPHFIVSPRRVVSEYVNEPKENFITNKFVFPNSNIAKLKAMVKDHFERDEEIAEMNPTRIEVLSSLLHGCAVRAGNSGISLKPTFLVHAVNLRSRMVNPLPQTAVGNFFWTFAIPTMSKSDIDLSLLAARIKKEKVKMNGVTESQLSQWCIEGAEAAKHFYGKSDFVVYSSSSTCGLPIYEVDFGWGKPVRATFAGCPVKNQIIFMDNPSGDSVEALVALDEEVMDTFQNDEQLLAITRGIEPPRS